MNNIGAHVSIAGGVVNAPINAAQSGYECFQMFTRSPRGGPASELNDTVIQEFHNNCNQNKIKNYYVHTPYYINLASKKQKIRKGSIKVIRDELERGSKLGAKALMTHLGSSKDYGKEKSLELVIEGVRKILDGYSGSTQFLLENSAGSGGTIIGSKIDEISAIIKSIPSKDIGVCFDTCHAFASGYDLRNASAVNKTLKKFEDIIGLSRLKLIHVNDSKNDLGSQVDRHEHLGYGKIGKDGFKALILHNKLKNMDFILETPPGKRETNDLKLLLKYRNEIKIKKIR